MVDEIHQIFAAQRRLGSAWMSETLEQVYLSIFESQRSFDEGPGGNSPFRGGVAEKVGSCTFETAEPRAAKATYTFEYFKLIQDRITGFVCQHCRISRQKLEDLMMETGFLTKDVGSILVGEDAVKHGILDEVGGIDRAIRKLREMMDSNIKKDDKAVEK